jgi:hypothetical protein
VNGSRGQSLRLTGGFGSALGFAAGIVVTTASVAGGAAGHPGLGLVALAVTVAGVSAVTTVWGAVATAAWCWAFYAGFILGRAGELAWDERSAQAAVVLGVVALVASTLGSKAARASAIGEELAELPQHRAPDSRMQ